MIATTIEKKTSTTIDLGPVPFLGELVHVRDRIVIDSKLQTKLKKELDASGARLVTLIGRLIEHAPGFNLVLPGHRVRVVATSYDAKGGSIDVSGGASGVEGKSGATGTAGVAFRDPKRNRKGGAGGRGATGSSGESAGTIHLLCERLGGVRMLANGRPGGKGGDGGDGGRGGPGVRDTPRFDGYEGTGGGPGGPAGTGGAGGGGGQIQVEFVAAANAQLIAMTAAGGAAGAAGAPGKGGVRGKPTDDTDGPRGALGQPGAAGAAGTTAAGHIDDANYWKRVAALLGPGKTNAWADYRLEAGIYFYRLFKPNQQKDMRLDAMAEFDAILRLRPGDAVATRYQQQIIQGQNVLGLSLDLDIIPNFDRIFIDYTAQVSAVTTFFQGSVAIILKANDAKTSKDLLQDRVERLTIDIQVGSLDKEAAERAKDAADEVFSHALVRINELSAEIQVKAAEKPDTSISIGSIVSTVVAVGGAVASVIAAVPTAGTSLFALVPALAGIGFQLTEIGQQVFAATQGATDALKSEYGKVGKSIDEAVPDVKAVINLVDAIKKLTASETADNAEVVAVMRQGVEAAYELLLARLHSEQADLTLTARTVRLEGDKQLQARAEALIGQLATDEKIFKEAGRSAILATQRRADSLLKNAFEAQRSIEIYTLKDVSGRIAFDSGYVSPDIDHDFDDGDIGIPDLVSAYTASWLHFLDALGLRDDYIAYFNDGPAFDFTGSLVFLQIADKPSLDAFRAENSLSFNIDLAELPADEFETKVEAVHVAFVGATSTKPFLRCSVRHGGRYVMLKRDGTEAQQLLEPHITRPTPPAQFTTLDPTIPTPSNGTGGQLNRLSFWGRGVGGQWEVAVNPNDLRIDNVNLDGLTEIQLWLETQAFIPVA